MPHSLCEKTVWIVQGNVGLMLRRAIDRLVLLSPRDGVYRDDACRKRDGSSSIPKSVKLLPRLGLPTTARLACSLFLLIALKNYKAYPKRSTISYTIDGLISVD